MATILVTMNRIKEVLLKEKISIENFEDKKFKIKLSESKKDTEAAFTHYLQNYKNGVSQFYKLDAIEHVKNLFEYKFPKVKITHTAAEEALQYLPRPLLKSGVGLLHIFRSRISAFGPLENCC